VDESSVSFRIWIRRSARAEAPFSVRFEVFDGKGILRVARPGILIDPPARVSGFDETLTIEQLKGSRFLHVWGAGRKRQSHILSRLDEARLDRLAADEWHELTVLTDGGYRYLQLDEDPRRDSAPVADAPREPTRPRAEVKELRTPPPRRSDPPSIETEPRHATTDPLDLPGSTVLVRILRRKLADVQMENTVLAAKVSTLEARLKS
jgi:hypothetical protein